MSEANTKSVFCELIAELDPVPVENLLTGKNCVGIPDVNFAGGWAEIKWCPRWPVRENTPLRVKFRPKQKEWALRRTTTTGEECWLILQVRQEWFVFDADGMQEVGNLTHSELIETARAYFPKKPTSEELLRILSSF